MLSMEHDKKAYRVCGVLLHRSLVRPLILICLIVLFGFILPMGSGSTPPNALAWSASNLFQNSDFETGSLTPWNQSAGPPGAAFVQSNFANRTPGGAWNLRINGVGQNVDVKQRVDGLTAGQRYYLGAFASQNTSSTGVPLGWGANPYGYTNCGFSYAVWNSTVDSYALLSCDNVIPAGYNFVAPKMSYNASSGYWAVADDWYLAAVPNKTTAHYVDTHSTSTLYNWGCTSAQSGESGYFTLAFGQPWYDGTQYGTNIYTSPASFASISEIKNLVQSYLDGYWNCGGPTAYVAVGTSNCSTTASCNGAGGYVNFAHGAAWSQMILDLRNYVASKGYGSRESVYGASDIEPSWGTPTASQIRNWIDGYQSIPNFALYLDFGSCDGCPFDVWYVYQGVGRPGCPACVPTNQWSIDDVWYVAWGASAAYPFPEIYLTDGRNASQWYRMTRYGVQNHPGNGMMFFQGTLTQQAACSQRGCGSTNSPGTGWGQLVHFLNFDQSVYTPIYFSSDISW